MYTPMSQARPSSISARAPGMAGPYAPQQMPYMNQAVHPAVSHSMTSSMRVPVSGHITHGSGVMPLTPKVHGTTMGGPQTVDSILPQAGPPDHASALGGTHRVVNSISSPMSGMSATNRVQALEQRVRELELLVSQKDEKIKELQGMVGAGGKSLLAAKKARSPGRSGSGGFRKVSDSKPVMSYSAQDQDDVIDVRLEEFYNSTGSAIQFRRINKGFYRFGDSIVELDIINHKLMARTEDGWNRGKFGPIEKFIMFYENIEREKAGISVSNYA